MAYEQSTIDMQMDEFLGRIVPTIEVNDVRTLIVLWVVRQHKPQTDCGIGKTLSVCFSDEDIEIPFALQPSVQLPIALPVTVRDFLPAKLMAEIFNQGQSVSRRIEPCASGRNGDPILLKGDTECSIGPSCRMGISTRHSGAAFAALKVDWESFNVSDMSLSCCLKLMEQIRLRRRPVSMEPSTFSGYVEALLRCSELFQVWARRRRARVEKHA